MVSFVLPWSSRKLHKDQWLPFTTMAVLLRWTGDRKPTDRITVMGQKFLAFDIETAKILPEAMENWRHHRPLGVCCAATLASDATEPMLWHGHADNGLTVFVLQYGFDVLVGAAEVRWLTCHGALLRGQLTCWLSWAQSSCLPGVRSRRLSAFRRRSGRNAH